MTPNPNRKEVTTEEKSIRRCACCWESDCQDPDCVDFQDRCILAQKKYKRTWPKWEQDFDDLWHATTTADAILEYAQSEGYDAPMNYPSEVYEKFKSLFRFTLHSALESQKRELREASKELKVYESVQAEVGSVKIVLKLVSLDDILNLLK